MNSLLNFFKLLSDETRMRIILLLSQKELCVCEMCNIMELSQPKVSRHLSKLRDMSLVKTERNEQWIFYQLDIKNHVAKEIIKVLAEHGKDLPIIKKDREKLLENMEENKMCKRNENEIEKKETKSFVQKAYGEIAKTGGSCCDSSASLNKDDVLEYALNIGYSPEELGEVPTESNMALGCGNPIALGSLQEGDTVLDLGSGGGFDCFLASRKVGETGKVIGIDLTPEMIETASSNAKSQGFKNVEFRLGEIENMPVDDNSVDVVISNCVINLSTDKQKVFQEIYRILKPGGRIAISDIALLEDLPKEIRDNMDFYAGCVSGALLVDEYKNIVESSGIKDVKIQLKGPSSCVTSDTSDPFAKMFSDYSFKDSIVSIYVTGIK